MISNEENTGFHVKFIMYLFMCASVPCNIQTRQSKAYVFIVGPLSYDCVYIAFSDSVIDLYSLSISSFSMHITVTGCLPLSHS